MDNLKYNSIIIRAIKEGKIKSSYSNTVGRQLTIFHSKEKIKQYIENKSRKIFLDHEYNELIVWNKSKKGIISVNKKNQITIPSIYIDKDKQINFLTALPYALALLYYKKSSRQKMIDIPFIYWLNYFTYKFFNYYIDNSRLEEIVNTHFSKDIINNEYFQKIKKEKVSSFSDSIVKNYYFNCDGYHLFYLNFKTRHLLYRFK